MPANSPQDAERLGESIVAAVAQIDTQQADSLNTDSDIIMATPFHPSVTAGNITSFFYAVMAVAIILIPHIIPAGSAKSDLSSPTSVHEGTMPLAPSHTIQLAAA